MFFLRPLWNNWGHLTRVSHKPQEQRYSFLLVSEVLSCVPKRAHKIMSMHAIAHGGCTDTVRESAPEADSGRKIPYRTGDSNPRQYCAWRFLAFQSDALPTDLYPPLVLVLLRLVLLGDVSGRDTRLPGTAGPGSERRRRLLCSLLSLCCHHHNQRPGAVLVKVEVAVLSYAPRP